MSLLECNKSYKGEGSGVYRVASMYPWKLKKSKMYDFKKFEVHPADYDRGIRMVFGDGLILIRMSAIENPLSPESPGKALCATVSRPWRGGVFVSVEQAHEAVVFALKNKDLPCIFFNKVYGNRGKGSHVCKSRTIVIPMCGKMDWPKVHDFSCQCTGDNVDDQLL